MSSSLRCDFELLRAWNNELMQSFSPTLNKLPSPEVRYAFAIDVIGIRKKKKTLDKRNYRKEERLHVVNNLTYRIVVYRNVGLQLRIRVRKYFSLTQGTISLSDPFSLFNDVAPPPTNNKSCYNNTNSTRKSPSYFLHEMTRTNTRSRSRSAHDDSERAEPDTSSSRSLSSSTESGEDNHKHNTRSSKHHVYMELPDTQKKSRNDIPKRVRKKKTKKESRGNIKKASISRKQKKSTLKPIDKASDGEWTVSVFKNCVYLEVHCRPKLQLARKLGCDIPNETAFSAALMGERCATKGCSERIIVLDPGPKDSMHIDQ